MADVLPLRPEVSFEPENLLSSAPRLRVGDALIRNGALNSRSLARALEEQKHQDQKLGRILLASEAISDNDLLQALAQQTGLAILDLEADPPDAGLVRAYDPYKCLELEAVPWRSRTVTLTIAIANPDLADEVKAYFASEDHELAFALAHPSEITAAIARCSVARMRDDAKTRCPESFSCRQWTRQIKQVWLTVIALACLAWAVIWPISLLQVLMVWILLANTATMGLRLTAIFARLTHRGGTQSATTPDINDYRRLPKVSILVPLLREEAVAKRLLDAMLAMDYPAALLDIKLILEENDAVTRLAIERSKLPRNIQIITVPNDGLKTKPRAMNYALPFCEGDIVGIYDAEDRPDPQQVRKVVSHLQHAPPDVACVQGYLDFYNSRTNWLSRCFTLEYAIWFRVILRGVQLLGLPIPLGGTTVFFRRDILEKIGAWDAHNVTEDADLGMRLARFGYRCEMVTTTTLEEANCRFVPWIKQRSRWLKGYAVTWATHMQNPRALFVELGARGFFGFQVLFLGALTSYLSIPLFWAVWIFGLIFGVNFWSSFPEWLSIGFVASMILGQVIMLLIATIAAYDSGRPGLVPYVLTLFLYWPLGAIAAYRAIGELFTRPSYWYKTEHGISYHSAENRRRGFARLNSPE